MVENSKLTAGSQQALQKQFPPCSMKVFHKLFVILPMFELSCKIKVETNLETWPLEFTDWEYIPARLIFMEEVVDKVLVGPFL